MDIDFESALLDGDMEDAEVEDAQKNDAPPVMMQPEPMDIFEFDDVDGVFDSLSCDEVEVDAANLAIDDLEEPRSQPPLEDEFAQAHAEALQTDAVAAATGAAEEM